MSTVIVLLLFLILMLLNIPIAVSLGSALLISVIFFQSTTDEFFIATMVDGISSFSLMAIPFFILAGELMGKGGVSERLINFANAMVGHLTGGFALATIITCMFFASISGSGPATVAAVGVIMIPAMTKRGYDVHFATATVAAAGSLGAIIPPSVDMILFSTSTGTSTGDMFIGGILPGILVASSLMIWAYVYSKRKGYKSIEGRFSIKAVFKTMYEAKWGLLIPIVILGGIYSGIFTPTESAAFAVLIGFLAGTFIYKELKIKDLPKIIVSASTTTVSIFFIISVAGTFGKILAIERVPSRLAMFLTDISENPIIIIAIISLVLLILGTFLESSAGILILAPILLPVAVDIGFDPVHFGLMMIVNFTIGFITPPLGVNIFIASGISGLSVEAIAKSLIPYFIALVLSLIIVVLWPSLSLFLPSLINK